MKTEVNDLRGAARHGRTEKRKWSTPRVIEEYLSNTQTPRPSFPSSLDHVYYVQYGS